MGNMEGFMRWNLPPGGITSVLGWKLVSFAIFLTVELNHLASFGWWFSTWLWWCSTLNSKKATFATFGVFLLPCHVCRISRGRGTCVYSSGVGTESQF